MRGLDGILPAPLPPMDDRLMSALRARAADDAERFRNVYPNEMPNERWLDNSFTAALPLAKTDSGADVPVDAQPELFAVYAEEVVRVVGGVREDVRQDDELPQQPTPGEH
ncbi:MAG TPA: hypothetical protein VJ276_09155 [Thermoanaerobaculia bacterium]|nr:hypothetical protein [Thermoanaerobaculia bacterium]